LHNHSVASQSLIFKLPHVEFKIIKKKTGYTVSTPPVGAIALATDSVSLPEGWALCDGNNGVPDYSGLFIKNIDSGIGNIVNDAAEISIDLQLASSAWSHSHYDVYTPTYAYTDGNGNQQCLIGGRTIKINNSYSYGMYCGNAGATHQHTITSSYSFTPAYFPVNFIKYIGA